MDLGTGMRIVFDDQGGKSTSRQQDQKQLFFLLRPKEPVQFIQQKKTGRDTQAVSKNSCVFCGQQAADVIAERAVVQ